MKPKMYRRHISDPVLFARFWNRKAGTEVSGGLKIEGLADRPFFMKSGISYADAMEGGSLLLEKRFTIKDTDISYRELNHWASHGLVDDVRGEESRSWRKLSVRDILWLKTLKELRDYGTPLERVKDVYEQQVHRPEKFVTTAFDDALCACQGEDPISAFLIVPKTGRSIIVSGKTLRIMERQGLPSHSYLRINLNELFCQIAGGSGVMPKVEEIAKDKASDEELKEIAEFIAASKDAEELKIKKKNGKISGLEATHRVSGSHRVGELLKDIHYGTATVTYANGKPVSTVITKKKRPQ